MPQGDGLCKKGSFSSLGSGKDKCCSLCDSDTFSALDGASECKACDTSANFFSSRGASSCEYFDCGKICADQAAVSPDCGADCLAGDCDFIGIVAGEEWKRDCEDRKSSAACFSSNARMLLFSATANRILPVSVTKSATNPFGPNFIALDVLFLPSDLFSVSPTEARQRFLAAAASGTLGGNISAVKIGDTIVYQRGPPSKTVNNLAQDVGFTAFPLWATILLPSAAAAVVICIALLRNDRALYKNLVNLIYKRPVVQPDVMHDEGGPDRRRSARIDIDALHTVAESNIFSDVGPSARGVVSSQIASDAFQERDHDTLQASQVQARHPIPPSSAPVNSVRRIRLTNSKPLSSSETTQVETHPDSNGLAPRRPLQPASASRNSTQTVQATAPLSSDLPESLMPM